MDKKYTCQATTLRGHVEFTNLNIICEQVSKTLTLSLN